ncbi:hypothetical protein QFC21_000211 [Naganishia friedmannii]|uniref:Uncharacterized protein n=1 Tax=Naganishia friedmannii TaxID=89922 RepID=A0ACC2WC18_9TREE|nr:hypothetical protein QFC21_000211 [Naganishia friedmannii]
MIPYTKRQVLPFATHILIVSDISLIWQAVAIVLGYLYASHMYAEVNPANARSVLAVATVFGIPELAAYAYEVCRQSLSVENIIDWVNWIDQQTPSTSDQVSTPPSPAPTPNNAPVEGSHVPSAGVPQSSIASEGMNFGTTPGVSYSPAPSQAGSSSSATHKEESTSQRKTSNGWQDVLSQPATSFVTRLKQDIYTFLVSQLPAELARSEQHTKLTEDPKFMRVFVQLPFDLFKACIEDSRLDLGSDMARFAFAKAAIQQRKKKAAPKNAQGQLDGTSVLENVVLRIGGGSGSKVHITRKSKPRALWKVNKD